MTPGDRRSKIVAMVKRTVQIEDFDSFSLVNARCRPIDFYLSPIGAYNAPEKFLISTFFLILKRMFSNKDNLQHLRSWSVIPAKY